MDDWELLEQFRLTGSEQAFAELVRRHAGFVYATCRRRVHPDPHLAEDVTQTVFLVLARRPPTRRRSSVLAGWLHQTAVYACNNAMRSKHTRDRHEREAAQPAAGRHSEGVDLETEVALDEALAELPAKERDAVLLRYYQDRDVQQVGAALGISPNAATKRLTRAAERLRQLMQARGIHVSPIMIGQQLVELSRARRRLHSSSPSSLPFRGVLHPPRSNNSLVGQSG